MLIVKTPIDLKEYIGKEFGPSDWIHIDQQRINSFADCTQDHQFIHTNPDLAIPILGGTIAHGFLTLSLSVPLMAGLMPMVENVVMGLNYGLNKVRFLQPVKSGSDVRAVLKIKDIEDKGSGRYLLTSELTVSIKGEDKPAYVAELLSMLMTK